MAYINAFIILKSILKKSIKHQERVNKALSLLMKSGIFKVKEDSNPFQGMPIITNKESTRMYEMEVQLININDRVNSIYLRTKEDLDSYHKRVEFINKMNGNDKYF